MNYAINNFTTATPEYFHDFIPYLNHLINTNGYSGSKVIFIEELPTRGKVGHPIVRFLVEGKYGSQWFSLHFRQNRESLQTEMDAMAQAHKLGVNVAQIITANVQTDNDFGAPFFIKQFIDGTSLHDQIDLVLNNPDILIRQLLLLHKPEAGGPGPFLPISVYEKKRSFLIALQSRTLNEAEHWKSKYDQVLEYCINHEHELTIDQHSLVHCGLIPTMITVAKDGTLWFHNWEGAILSHDYCFDLALIRFSIFGHSPKTQSIHIAKVTQCYKREFGDSTIEARLRYYIAERCLMEISHRCSQGVSLKAVQPWYDALASYWDDYPA